jgi:RNA polymerase sigma factor (TIGR02999 family)
MESSNVTVLLEKVKKGDIEARERLLNIVYSELRTLASRKMRQERKDHTLQPSALVHEVYLRLFEDPGRQYTDRKHFFAMAATEMRRVLVDYARQHHAQKRGGLAKHVTLDDALAYSCEHAEEMLALDAALDHLAAMKPECARIVEMTYFGGMTQREAAELLNCSEKTVKRRWTFARSFLLEELRRETE